MFFLIIRSINHRDWDYWKPDESNYFIWPLDVLNLTDHIADEVEKHLEECASDNLIAVTRKVGQKGSKVGIEQEGFRLPTPPVNICVVGAVFNSCCLIQMD